MKTHKDLEVWKKSIELVTIIYKETSSFPNSEYGLTSQIRRSFVSIPSNIAKLQHEITRKNLKDFF